MGVLPKVDFATVLNTNLRFVVTTFNIYVEIVRDFQAKLFLPDNGVLFKAIVEPKLVRCERFEDASAATPFEGVANRESLYRDMFLPQVTVERSRARDLGFQVLHVIQ